MTNTELPPGAKPVVLSWDALAKALNCNRRTLLDLRNQDGAPSGRDPFEWRAFLASRSSVANPARGTDALPGNCSYDAAVVKGQISYADAKVREQVVGEQIANETKRGALVSRDVVKAKVELAVSACIEAMALIPDLYVADLPAEQKAEGRKRAKEWILTVRERMSTILSGGASTG